MSEKAGGGRSGTRENLATPHTKGGESQKFSDQLPFVKALISLLKFAIFRLWGARPKKAADQTRHKRSAGA